jgi:hypothetical protein
MARVLILLGTDRWAVTGRMDGFAVARDLRGSLPMGSVADLSNVYRGTIQGRYSPVNSPKCA